jgi:hypothetical protein
MQTFFPFSDAKTSLGVLDTRRLGKQRVEGYQILRTLQGYSNGWKDHPAVKMWRGYEPELLDYTLTACEIWAAKNFTDTISDKLFEEFPELVEIGHTKLVYPSWCYNQDVLDSHKAMLYHKDPAHYALFAPYSHITAYVWPV